VLAAELSVGPYEAARLADALRKALVERGESFVFETVFSDPVGEKVAFLEEAARSGYVVVLCYIGLSGPDQSAERVAMRVSQGGHDVPDEKLQARFSRTLANLRTAIARLPYVLTDDHSDLEVPYRQVAVFVRGQPRQLQEPIPEWLRSLLPS
jgi:predicted ABC-type ATPase